MSTSRFTSSFSFRFDRLVVFSVCGIRLTENVEFDSFDTVRLTPFIATDPFVAMYFFRFFGVCNVNTFFSIDLIFVQLSMCPCTMCPSIL